MLFNISADKHFVLDGSFSQTCPLLVFVYLLLFGLTYKNTSRINRIIIVLNLVLHFHKACDGCPSWMFGPAICTSRKMKDCASSYKVASDIFRHVGACAVIACTHVSTRFSFCLLSPRSPCTSAVPHRSCQSISSQEHDLTRVNYLSVSGKETAATETLSGSSVTSPFPADLIVIS